MHHPFKFLAAVALGYLILLATFGDTAATPAPTTSSTNPPIIEYRPITTSSTTSTSTTAPPAATAHDALQADLEDPNTFVVAELDADLPCREWAPLALDVGWPAEELPQLLKVIWRESRCQPDALRADADHGLTQINAIHADWLATMGLTLDDMLDPRLNLEFAYRLWSSREERGQCGWTPWSVECP